MVAILLMRPLYALTDQNASTVVPAGFTREIFRLKKEFGKIKSQKLDKTSIDSSRRSRGSPPLITSSVRGLAPNGIEVPSIAAKKRSGQAVDVNPPVTVRNRADTAATGSHQSRHRPIDIDRTPGMIGSRRFNGKRVLENI
jgi:hypothetical protein